MEPPQDTPKDTTSPDAGRNAAVTELLARAGRGEAHATDELFPIVYDELRSIAARFLHDESNTHTLQATSLVHETYLRLVGPGDVSWQNRAHFFAAAAQAIRRILVDHARHRNRTKRGGGRASIPLDEALQVADDPGVDVLGLDEALTKLASLDPQKARVVELRFFVGLTVEQVAETLGVSAATVARAWQFARVWLARELATAPSPQE
jgi:RNA polymerase sigma-70 factor, ECF subfamily